MKSKKHSHETNKIIQKIPREKKIIVMESDNNRAAFRYTIIHLSDGIKMLSGYNLKFYEDRTDNQSFMRLNRSEMINKTFAKFINIDDFSLTLHNGRRIHISRFTPPNESFSGLDLIKSGFSNNFEKPPNSLKSLVTTTNFSLKNSTTFYLKTFRKFDRFFGI